MKSKKKIERKKGAAPTAQPVLGANWWRPKDKLPQPGECVLILVGVIYITAWYYRERHSGRLNWQSFNGYDCNNFPVRAWRRIPHLNTVSEFLHRPNARRRTK